jgi:hypothetical protein
MLTVGKHLVGMPMMYRRDDSRRSSWCGAGRHIGRPLHGVVMAGRPSSVGRRPSFVVRRPSFVVRPSSIIT